MCHTARFFEEIGNAAEARNDTARFFDEGMTVEAKRFKLNPEAVEFVPADVAMFGDAGLDEEHMGGFEHEHGENDDDDDLVGALFSEEDDSFKPDDTDEEEDQDEDEEGDEDEDNEESDEEKEQEGRGEDGQAEEKEKDEEGESEEDETATMQTQNVTELMKNHTLLIEDKIDINFLQECKIKEADKGKIEKCFKDENYDLIRRVSP